MAQHKWGKHRSYLELAKREAHYITKKDIDKAAKKIVEETLSKYYKEDKQDA